MMKSVSNDRVPKACPNGHVGRIVRNGSQGGRQRYRCKLCGTQFRDDELFRLRGKYPIQQIGAAVAWYFSDLSYRRVAQKVACEFKRRPPNSSSVCDWVQEYSRLAKEALGDLRVRTGKSWLDAAHPVEIGGRSFYLSHVMDYETRFLLDSSLAADWNEDERTEIRKRAESAAVKPPDNTEVERYQSDFYMFLGDDPRFFMYSRHPKIPVTIYDFLTGGSIRRPYHTLRTMRTLSTAQTFLDGWRVDYNLFRPQDDLGGKTPAEAAGMDSPFSSWADVVRKARTIVENKTARARVSVSRRPRRDATRTL